MWAALFSGKDGDLDRSKGGSIGKSVPCSQTSFDKHSRILKNMKAYIKHHLKWHMFSFRFSTSLPGKAGRPCPPMLTAEDFCRHEEACQSTLPGGAEREAGGGPRNACAAGCHGGQDCRPPLSASDLGPPERNWCRPADIGWSRQRPEFSRRSSVGDKPDGDLLRLSNHARLSNPREARSI